jgi:O-antigen/teichoic acid export membrane protein
MRKEQVVKNAGAAFIQVVATGLLMFFLYRYLLHTIGVKRLGIWSVVLATTSASRITELGLTGSVVKFVAKYVANHDQTKAGAVIETAAISIGVFVGALLLAVYVPLHWILARVLPVTAMPEATAILPYTLVSLWLATVGGVFQSGLDGCLRTDLRASFNILNNCLTLAMAVMLVPKFGLLGLAYTQVALAGLLLLLSWIYLRTELRELPYVPHRWTVPIFKEILQYGIAFQTISFVGMLLDPITKGLLSRYGGLASAGYYEMANRMTSQFRALLTAPNQILVPVIADLHETESDRTLSVYKLSYRLQMFLSLPLYAGVLAAIPVVSVLWIGTYQRTFVLYSALLTLGWFLNGLINPAYFSNLGTGALKWNVIAHVVMGVSNAILGVFLGIEYGGTGVVVARVFSLVIGSSMVIVPFFREHGLSWGELFPRENLWLTIACAAGAGVAWFAYSSLHGDFGLIWTASACLAAFSVAISVPGWRHPMRARLFGMIPGRWWTIAVGNVGVE